jgi:hypothetical protein
MKELIEKMARCRNLMFDTAAEMDYYGGLSGQIKEKSVQLLGASGIISNWIEEMAAGYVS